MIPPLIFLAFFTPLLNLLINPFVYFDFLSSDIKATKTDQCLLHTGSKAIPHHCIRGQMKGDMATAFGFFFIGK